MTAIANASHTDTRRKELLRKAERHVQAEISARKYDRALLRAPDDMSDPKKRQAYVSLRVQAVYKHLLAKEPQQVDPPGIPPLLVDRLETIATSIPQLVKLFRSRELQLINNRSTIDPDFAAQFDRNVVFIGIIVPACLFAMAFAMAAAIPSRIWVLPLFMAISAQAVAMWRMRAITCSNDPAFRRHRYLAWSVSGLHGVTITVMIAATLTALLPHITP